MRKQVLLLLVVLLSLTGCSDSFFADSNSRPDQVETLTNTLTGQWRVVVARAGDEDITGLYQGYIIEFLGDGQYIITNPTGAPNPNRNNSNNTGFWAANADNSITIDSTVLMRIVGEFLQGRFRLSWDVTIIGKGTNTYYWEIVPV